MIKEIKPCPFCKGTVDVVTGLGGITFIRCDKCGANTSFIGAESIKYTLKKWNKRSEK